MTTEKGGFHIPSFQPVEAPGTQVPSVTASSYYYLDTPGRYILDPRVVRRDPSRPEAVTTVGEFAGPAR